jgi:hypothetical protein
VLERGRRRREPRPHDRRQVRLSVTPSGQAVLGEAREGAQAELADVVGTLNARQRAGVVEAMRLLRELFTPEAGGGASSGAGGSSAESQGARPRRSRRH